MTHTFIFASQAGVRSSFQVSPAQIAKLVPKARGKALRVLYGDTLAFRAVLPEAEQPAFDLWQHGVYCFALSGLAKVTG